MFFFLLLLLLASSDEIKFNKEILADISGYTAGEGMPNFQRLREHVTVQGNGAVECALGICHLRNIGVKGTAQVAFKWMEKSAMKGYPEGYKNVAIMLSTGLGTAADLRRSFEYLIKAVNGGNHAAERILGAYYAYGSNAFVPKNHREAVIWLDRAMQGGDPDAFSILADLCMKGWGPNLLPRVEKSLIYFKQAIDAGHEKLGTDLRRYLDKTQRNAEGGNMAAWCMLGCFYYYGVGMAPNNEEAYHFMERASRNLEALYNKAILLLFGLGVERDIQTAFSTFAACATGGHVSSKRVFGELNFRGVCGRAQDFETALRFMEEAASLGDVRAQFNLWFMLKDANRQKAKEWLEVAAENGLEVAQEILDDLLLQEQVFVSNSAAREEPEVALPAAGSSWVGIKYLKSFFTTVDSGRDNVELLKKNDNLDEAPSSVSRQTVNLGVPWPEGFRNRKHPVKRPNPHSYQAADDDVGQAVTTAATVRSPEQEWVLSIDQENLLRLECQQSFNMLKEIKCSVRDIQFRSCDQYNTAKIFCLLTQRLSNKIPVAAAIGITPLELSKVKNPDKYNLDKHSEVRAWQWFQNTPMVEITRLTGVSEREVLYLFN